MYVQFSFNYPPLPFKFFPATFDEYSYRWADRILFPFNFPGVQIKGGGRVYVDFIALSDL